MNLIWNSYERSLWRVLEGFIRISYVAFIWISYETFIRISYVAFIWNSYETFIRISYVAFIWKLHKNFVCSILMNFMSPIDQSPSGDSQTMMHRNYRHILFYHTWKFFQVYVDTRWNAARRVEPHFIKSKWHFWNASGSHKVTRLFIARYCYDAT